MSSGSDLEIVLDEQFITMELPADWKNIDADGDGQIWKFKNYWFGADGNGYSIGSESWSSGYKATAKPALTPDNWLITPKLSLPAGAKLQYNIGAHSATYDKETYAVYISLDGDAVENFSTELYKEDLSAPNRFEESKSPKAVWLGIRTIDLSEYAGKDVHIAFRHFESSDQMAILLDDIKVWAPNSNPPVVEAYKIFKNDEEIKVVTELSFTDNDVAIGIHNYAVQAKYADGSLSEKVNVQAAIFDQSKKASIVLEAHDVWGDNSGYQILLDNTATQFGLAIPLQGPLTSSCVVPASLHDQFTHFVPADANLSCTPNSFVFDGKVEVEIPAGLYDWCVVNPSPGQKIWIAGDARFDDYPFEGGKRYHVLAEKDPNSTVGGDHVVITISEIETPTPNPATNLQGVYDAENKKVILSWDAPVTREEAALYDNFDQGIPSTWKLIDSDADGNNWMANDAPLYPGYEGSPLLISFSWLGSALNPDNWIISPKFKVPENAKLSFWIGAASDVFFGDKFGEYISETTDEIGAFQELLIETTQEETGKKANPDRALRDINKREVGAWGQRTIDHSAWAGKEVYIGFRHFESEDIFGLVLDEVKVSGTGEEPNPQPSTYYNVYCDGELLGAVETLNYEHNNSTPGTYKYEVEVKYANGDISPKVAVEVQIPAEQNYAPVTELEGKYDQETQITTLTWKAPVQRREAALHVSFEGGIPEGWLNIDADGDGHKWVSVSDEFSGVNPETGVTELGTDCPCSASYINGKGTPLTPDNWLITPKVKVPANGKLSFWVRGYDPFAFQEHYGVFLSETNTELASFTKELHSETLERSSGKRVSSTALKGSVKDERGLWNFREVDMSEYAGKEVYIGFRHYECTDVYWLLLDEVVLAGEGEDPDPLTWTYNVYRNEEIALEGLTEEKFEDINPASGNYKYEVEVKYSDGGLSPKAEVFVTVACPDPTENVSIFLKANDVWEDGTGYQIWFDNTAQLYGNVFSNLAPMLDDCDVPAGFAEQFSHSLPENAEMSCTPEHQVVDGEEMVKIPAGTYDYAVVNPQPGVKIWIASGEFATQDDYTFEAGKEYHFEATFDGMFDNISLTIIDSIEQLFSAMKAYGIEGHIVIESDRPIDISIYDMQGRRIATQRIEGKRVIPAQAGAYIVQLEAGSQRQASKLIVK